jgi:DNA-binding XRE family transcriptional regulator
VSTLGQPEISPSDLLIRALERAREMAAEAEEACHDADAEEGSRLRARASAAQEHMEILQAAVAALADQSSRESPAARPAEPLQDADGYDLRPNPLSTRTPAGFVACLRAYRQWSGKPSLRKIAEQSGNRVSHSTIRAILRSESLPSLANVEAIIAGCGGTQEDQRTFATAWRFLALAAPPEEPIQDRAAFPGGEPDAAPFTSFVNGRVSPPSRGSGRPVSGSPSANGQDMTSFGILLRKYRAEAGLTQEEMSERARISQRSLSDVERGVVRRPHATTARLLADALGLSGSERERFMAVAHGHQQEA